MKKILLIGTGSIAERHLKNIIKLDRSADISVYSRDERRAKNFSKKFKKKINIEKKGIRKKYFTHIIIASRTSSHNKHLKLLSKNGKNIYCEKPLPWDNDIKILKNKSFLKINNFKIKIGYQIRFNPAIKYLVKELLKKENKKIFLVKILCGQNLKDWRKNSDYKKLYSAGKKNYGAVYWELSHEIDLLNHLLGKITTVYSEHKNTENLKIKVHDLSNTILNFKNKKISCSISLEMISPILYRKLIVVTTSNFYEIDLVNNTVLKKNKIRSKYLKFKSDRNKMFKEYMKNFLSNKKYSKNFPFANLRDGLNTSEVINAMIKSNKTNKLVRL
jgi:predicted dehydrogenase